MMIINENVAYEETNPETDCRLSTPKVHWAANATHMRQNPYKTYATAQLPAQNPKLHPFKRKAPAKQQPQPHTDIPWSF